MLPEREWFDLTIQFTDGIYSASKTEAELYNQLYLGGKVDLPIEVKRIEILSKSQETVASFIFRHTPKKYKENNYAKQ